MQKSVITFVQFICYAKDIAVLSNKIYKVMQKTITYNLFII